MMAKPDKNEFDFKKARHEVFKFGLSGMDSTAKQDAKIAHAISLGAKPLKRKCKNYKQLMEENKKQKTKESIENATNKDFRLNSKLKKKNNDNNSVKGFDHQIGKFKNGVLFVDKKELLGKK